MDGDLKKISHHKVGHDQWNTVRRALEPFVAIYAPGAQSQLDRMADAVVDALRDGSATDERPQEPGATSK